MTIPHAALTSVGVLAASLLSLAPAQASPQPERNASTEVVTVAVKTWNTATSVVPLDNEAGQRIRVKGSAAPGTTLRIVAKSKGRAAERWGVKVNASGTWQFRVPKTTATTVFTVVRPASANRPARRGARVSVEPLQWIPLQGAGPVNVDGRRHSSALVVPFATPTTLGFDDTQCQEVRFAQTAVTGAPAGTTAAWELGLHSADPYQGPAATGQVTAGKSGAGATVGVARHSSLTLTATSGVAGSLVLVQPEAYCHAPR